jgi:hypothetical protein
LVKERLNPLGEKKRYHVDPNSVVVDFTSSGDAWYDSVELTRMIAGDNAITEIDERLGTEFGALKQIDVCKAVVVMESIS